MASRNPGLPWYQLDVVYQVMSKLREIDPNSINKSSSLFVEDMDKVVVAEIWFGDHSRQWYVNWLNNE